MIEETEALFADEPEIAPVETATEEAMEAQPEPVGAEASEVTEIEPVAQPDKPEAGYVPIAALMDERDRRKAAEQRAQQFEQQRQPQSAPNPYDDPDGYAAHQQSLVQQAILADRFERSNEDAIEKFGEDTVKSAIEWAQSRAGTNPSFAAEYMSKPRPIHWIVQQHKRDALLSEIGDNPDDWFAREAVKRGLVPPSVSVAATSEIPAVAQPKQANTPAKVPPRSLATQGSGPSDVRDVASGPLAGVDAVFPQ